jgi:hypothetical protein
MELTSAKKCVLTGSERVSAGRALDLPVYFGDAGSKEVGLYSTLAYIGQVFLHVFTEISGNPFRYCIKLVQREHHAQ